MLLQYYGRAKLVNKGSAVLVSNQALSEDDRRFSAFRVLEFSSLVLLV